MVVLVLSLVILGLLAYCDFWGVFCWLFLLHVMSSFSVRLSTDIVGVSCFVWFFLFDVTKRKGLAVEYSR